MKIGIIILMGLLSGCATVISGPTQEVGINSIPARSNFTIVDSHGKIVHDGITPEVVTLKTGEGYFDNANYSIKFDGEITSLDASINKWYFGNLLLGGIIGMVIVDPITGAMWVLPDASTTRLKQ